jgi:hypothetical protein
MRGNGVRSVLAENNKALSAKQTHEKWISKRPKLCWKCQKDKPREGGLMRLMDGFGGKLQKFICKDCLDAKQRSTECQDQSHQNP